MTYNKLMLKKNNKMEIVDLSHLLNNNISIYPESPKVEIKKIADIKTEGYKEHSLNITTHSGTHLDCPSHILENTLSTETMTIDNFYGKGLVINCLNLRDKTVIDFRDVEKYQEKIKEVDFVLFLTGWDKYWQTDEYYKNFPVISSELADKLIEANLKGIGLDTISVDRIGDKQENHQKLLAENIIIIENLTKLNFLLDKEFTFICFPLKIEDGDASPIRAVGISN